MAQKSGEKLLSGLLLAALLLGALHAQARSLISTEEHIFHLKDDPNTQKKVLEFLLDRGAGPEPADEVTRLELVGRLVQLEELEALRQDLALEQEPTSNAIGKETTRPSKRAEACFWKYCV